MIPECREVDLPVARIGDLSELLVCLCPDMRLDFLNIHMLRRLYSVAVCFFELLRREIPFTFFVQLLECLLQVSLVCNQLLAVRSSGKELHTKELSTVFSVHAFEYLSPVGLEFSPVFLKHLIELLSHLSHSQVQVFGHQVPSILRV